MVVYVLTKKPCDVITGYFSFGHQTCGILTRRRRAVWCDGIRLVPIHRSPH